MCGICGVMFSEGLEGRVGEILFAMQKLQQNRAQDSAGVAVLSKSSSPKIKIQVMERNPTIPTKYCFKNIIASPDEFGEVLRRIEENPYMVFISNGHQMTLLKDLGLATQVNSAHCIEGLYGTHGIGHLRIATSSAETPINAHPFSTPSLPDLAVVHNGEINNYGRLRRDLELKGHKFYSECDSELIVVYLADRLKVHNNFEQANYEFIKAGDGPFTYIAVYKYAIAVVRDKYGLRKAMVGINPGTNTTPPFVAIASDVSALNEIGANRHVHTPEHGKVEIFNLGQKFEVGGQGNNLLEEALKAYKPSGSVKVFDVNDIKSKLAQQLTGLSIEEQRQQIQRLADEQYGITLPLGLIRLSYIKFGNLYDSPLILSNIVNSLLRKGISEGIIDFEIRNPHGLYSLAAGLEGKVNLAVIGDVGNSFAEMANIEGTLKVYGTAENGLANHAYRGKVVVYVIATELAGLTNQNADILLLGGGTERTGAQMRGGSIVAFGLGYNSGLYLNEGVILNLGLDKPGEEIGTGMTGGVMYVPEQATLGKNARKLPLHSRDYDTIRLVLSKHTADLQIEGLGQFSPISPILHISNGTTRMYDFKDFVKIVPKS